MHNHPVARSTTGIGRTSSSRDGAFCTRWCGLARNSTREETRGSVFLDLVCGALGGGPCLAERREGSDSEALSSISSPAEPPWPSLGLGAGAVALGRRVRRARLSRPVPRGDVAGSAKD